MSRRRSARSSAIGTEKKYTTEAFFGDLDFGDEPALDSSDGEDIANPTTTQAAAREDDSGSGSDGSVFHASENEQAAVVSSSDSEPIIDEAEESSVLSASPVLSDIVDFSPPPSTSTFSHPHQAKKQVSSARTTISAAGTGTIKKQGGRAPRGSQAGKKQARNYREGGPLFAQVIPETPIYTGSRLPNHEKTYGMFVNQDTLCLTHGFDDPIHCSSIKGKGKAMDLEDEQSIEGQTMSMKGLAVVPAATEKGRGVSQDWWSAIPYGPVWQMCEDVAWYKGRNGNRKKWGGWYDEVPSRLGDVQRVQTDQAITYFPFALYPNKSRAIHLPTTVSHAETKAGKREAMKAEELFAPSSPDASGMDLDPAQPVASTSQPLPTPTPAPQAAEDLAPGTLQFYYGPVDLNQPDLGQQLITMERFSTLRLNKVLPNKPGFMLNAGGPVWSLDWCPLPDYSTPSVKEYLAISTVSTTPPIGDSSRLLQPNRKGLIQIWSMDCTCPAEFGRSVPDEEDLGEGMKFELGVCSDYGEAWKLTWVPRGGAEEVLAEEGQFTRIGILAGVFTDGAVHLLGIPTPDQLPGDENVTKFIEGKALLTMRLPDTAITCMDFSSHETLVTGCDNGSIAVWSFGEALRTGQTTIPPIQYFSLHMSPIRDVSVMRFPAVDAQLQELHNIEPRMVTTAGYDGSHMVVDLQDVGSSLTVVHERTVSMVSTFQPMTGLSIMDDQDYALRGFSLRPRNAIVTLKMYAHNAPVFDVAVSDFHPYIASSSADGTILIFNALRRAKKRAHSTHFTKKLYRLDFNRKTGEYRMLDNLYPEFWPGGTKALNQKKAKSAKHVNPPGAMQVEPAPPQQPEIAIHCASWCKSIRRAAVVASGGACGLVRIDMTEGPSPGKRSIVGSRDHAAEGEDEEEGEGDDD